MQLNAVCNELLSKATRHFVLSMATPNAGCQVDACTEIIPVVSINIFNPDGSSREMHLGFNCFTVMSG
jgi:hypothetical protein